MTKFLHTLVACFVLSLGGAASAGNANGATLFSAHCAMCHLDPNAAGGSAKIGPPLAGIIGAKAASDSDYKRYSAALRRSGKVWTDSALSAYIAAPSAAVPGTTMALASITSAAEREAIIAYLKAAPAR